ncbi:hypothetical protein KC19_2G055000 [Ceratodon purpureus]|uniref:Uncharacterized protein n=1 Tax=Ceratodon purpureus TaxID=3225 RepID=A0A8T0IT85_CERPU|nr:hypothetical protein KC19_2G055000 [Ceratodon purpureus]
MCYESAGIEEPFSIRNYEMQHHLIFYFLSRSHHAFLSVSSRGCLLRMLNVSLWGCTKLQRRTSAAARGEVFSETKTPARPGFGFGRRGGRRMCGIRVW